MIVGMILAAAAGGLVGELVGSFLPEGTMKTLFQTHVDIGMGRSIDMEEVEPLRIDLYAVSLVFGITLRINLLSILFVLLLFIYFRWWYL